jgi:putative ABC transport system permease protein
MARHYSHADMRPLDIFRIALRMLRTNVLRSLLTVLGIGVAITFIVILIGFGYGVQSLTIGSIIQSKELLSLNISTDVKSTTALTPAVVKELGALPGVTGSSPVILTSGQVTIAGQLAAVSVESANRSYLDMEGVSVPIGKVFDDGKPEAVVTQAVLDLIGLSANEVVGHSLDLSYADPDNENNTKTLNGLIISGVAPATDSPTVFVPINILNATGTAKLTSVKLVAANREDIVTIRSAATNKGYVVESLLETLDQAKKVFYYTTLTLATFGTIALVVASIGMFNTLTIALIERTREIGIMKAIGVTDASVRRLFLTEAAIIGFLGGVAGITVGVGAGAGLEYVLNRYAVAYQSSAIQLFQYPSGFLVGILVFPVILSMVTGLYPAIRASRLNPLQALRYE